MRKTIGYILRTFSVLFFVWLSFSMVGAILAEDYVNNEPSYIIGYLFGIFMATAAIAWLNYKLYQFSGKLIAVKKAVSEIDDIGKQDI